MIVHMFAKSQKNAAKSRGVTYIVATVALVAGSLLSACNNAAPTSPRPPGADQPAAPAQPAPVDQPAGEPPVDSAPLVSPLESPLPAGGKKQVGDVEIGDAKVDKIELIVAKDDPKQATVKVGGFLGDSCTDLADTEQDVVDGKIVVRVRTSRPAGRMCAAVVKDFSIEVPLELDGLAAGEYIVDVNGLTRGLKVDAQGGLSIP
jgi:hypothetical protein